MSLRKTDKCSQETARDFGKVVKGWLDKNNLSYSKLVALTSYEGEVRIYNGKEINRLSHKTILQQDENGYFRSKNLISEKEYFSTFLDDWVNKETRDEEKELIIRFLTGKTDYEPIDFIP